MTKQAEIKTLNNTMRHVDTICAISAKHHDNATLGMNLANNIDSMLSFDLDKESMVKELERLVAEFRQGRFDTQERFNARGKKIDATVYSDEVK